MSTIGKGARGEGPRAGKRGGVEAVPASRRRARGLEHRRFHPGATELGFDPEAADAAADLAGELGVSFLEGATRGEDPSDLEAMRGDAGDDDLSFVIEDTEDPLDADDEPEVRPARRAR